MIRIACCLHVDHFSKYIHNFYFIGICQTGDIELPFIAWVRENKDLAELICVNTRRRVGDNTFVVYISYFGTYCRKAIFDSEISFLAPGGSP